MKPPSLNTGWVNRFVVIIGTVMPALARASLNRAMCLSRSVARPERDQVVVVERDPVRAELGEPVHRLDRVEGRPGGVAERVTRRPANRPQSEVNRSALVGVVPSWPPVVDLFRRETYTSISGGQLAGVASRASMIQQGTQHVLHDSAVPVVVGFARSIDAYARVELHIAGAHRNGPRDRTVVESGHTGDVERLLTGQPQRPALWPSGNCSGSTPIPIRLER